MKKVLMLVCFLAVLFSGCAASGKPEEDPAGLPAVSDGETTTETEDDSDTQDIFSEYEEKLRKERAAVLNAYLEEHPEMAPVADKIEESYYNHRTSKTTVFEAFAATPRTRPPNGGIR